MILVVVMSNTFNGTAIVGFGTGSGEVGGFSNPEDLVMLHLKRVEHRYLALFKTQEFDRYCTICTVYFDLHHIYHG